MYVGLDISPSSVGQSSFFFLALITSQLPWNYHFVNEQFQMTFHSSYFLS
jgi:hypothetical protein